MPLEKQSLNNFLPDGFETNNLEGYKENFSADKIATGYEKDVKDRVSGPNFNNLLDVLGKNTNVLTNFMDFIKNMPINNLFAVDENNQLVYKNLDEVGGGGLEIGDIGIAPLGIDETKGKRRYLNGQILIQEQYQTFTAKLKEAINLYPTLACSEDEWQTTATMTVGGQVGKFVVDNDAGTIRLPKIIMPIQGLTDLSKLGEIVEAGLPNITGKATALRASTSVGSGSITTTDTGNYSYGDYSSSGSSNYYTVAVNASLSSPIYGNSDTVQQEQIQYPYFIQVATGAETKEDFENEQVLNIPFFIGYSQYFENAPYNLSWSVGGSTLTRAVHPDYYDSLLIELNADIEVGTTQNNYTKRGLPVKLATDSDITDYDFVVNTADETFTLPLLNGSEDLPSVHIKSYTVTASGNTYTAPSNGWFVARVTASKDTVSTFTRLTNKNQNKYVSNSVTYGSTDYHTYANLFCKKGDEVVMEYGANSTNPELNFTYAQGNGSLYFYVGEVAQNTNLVNAGRIEETMATKSMVDGQWVYPSKSSTYSKWSTKDTNTIDLSGILPNDGYNYECLFNISFYTNDVGVTLYIGTDLCPLDTSTPNWVYEQGAGKGSSGTINLAVGSSRYVQVNASAVPSGGTFHFCVMGYRRLGTNV